MLVNFNKILNDARREKYAVAHFNINNLEWAKYILEKCEDMKVPVILGVSEGAVKYMGGYYTVSNLVTGLIVDLNISIPVVLHLDHGSSFESCKNAIDAGFTSVMIDASKFDIEENINITKQVVQYAKLFNVSVEAEIGHIGGTEDNITSKIAYANVDECIRLVNETDIDALAPAIGNQHGLYNGKPKLNIDLVKELSTLVNVPLVLHGGTGIGEETIVKLISSGISKINVNTSLQVVWQEELSKFIKKNKYIYDPRKIISSGEKAIKLKIENVVSLLGTKNTD